MTDVPPIDNPYVLPGDTDWPDMPDDVRPMTRAERESVFGSFTYVAQPMPGNPEAIRITSTSGFRLETVDVPVVGRVTLNAAFVPRVVSFFTEIEECGLGPLVVSWDGAYVPRFVRGSKTSLSNHAWGTAFDINAAQNWMGAVPAGVGMRGSVRRLAAIAGKHMLWWRGWRWTNSAGIMDRYDGMHFEAAMAVP